MRRLFLLAPVMALALSACSGPPNGPQAPITPPANSQAPGADVFSGSDIPKGKLKPSMTKKVDKAILANLRSTSNLSVDGADGGERFSVTIVGKNCKGRAVTGGSEAEFLQAAGITYLRSPLSTWKKNLGPNYTPALGQMLKGKWVKMPVESGVNFDSLCTPSKLFKDDEFGFSKGDVVTNKGKIAYKGQAAIKLSIKGKKKGQSGTMIMTYDGKLYPLRISGPGFNVKLGGFSANKSITAPPAGKTFVLG